LPALKGAWARGPYLCTQQPRARAAGAPCRQRQLRSRRRRRTGRGQVSGGRRPDARPSRVRGAVYGTDAPLCLRRCKEEGERAQDLSVLGALLPLGPAGQIPQACRPGWPCRARACAAAQNLDDKTFGLKNKNKSVKVQQCAPPRRPLGCEARPGRARVQERPGPAGMSRRWRARCRTR